MISETKTIQCEVIYKNKKRIIIDVGGHYISTKVESKINSDFVTVEYKGSLLKDDFKIVSLY